MAEDYVASGDYPQQGYYPSWKIRLIIRFDEFGQTKKVDQKAPKKIVTVLKGTKDARGTLAIVNDPNSPPGVKRFLLQPPAGNAPGGPQMTDKSGDQLTHTIGAIIPSRMAFGLNGIRQADTLKVDLRFVDLPFDPRVIRSCAIQAYLGTITAEQYEAGVGGAVKTTGSDAGEPLNVVPDEWIDENGTKRTNMRFEGWVDEWETEWPEDEEPTVHLECRDNTTMLLEQDAPAKLVVSADLGIDEAVATYLSNFPQFAGLSVEYRPAVESVPKLGASLAKTAYKPTLGPAPSKGGGAAAKLSVWDYLTDLCGSIGHNVRVEGTTVVIQQVRTLTSNQTVQRPEDPFFGRVAGGQFINTRRMIYGRNVMSMKIARKFTKSAPKNVEVRCYNPKRKQVIVARFPVGDQKLTTDVNPGDGNSEQKWLVWRVSGIEDDKVLRVVAQSIYESIGRNELNVNIKTYNLASFGGGNADPDLLDMKAGDSIELLVSREEEELNSTSQIENLLLVAAQAKTFLNAVGYSGEMVDAYAKAYSDAGFQTSFRVRSLGIVCDIDEGVQLDIQAVNYIEARVDRQLPAGEEIKGTPGAKTQKKGQ